MALFLLAQREEASPLRLVPGGCREGLGTAWGATALCSHCRVDFCDPVVHLIIILALVEIVSAVGQLESEHVGPLLVVGGLGGRCALQVYGLLIVEGALGVALSVLLVFVSGQSPIGQYAVHLVPGSV